MCLAPSSVFVYNTIKHRLAPPQGHIQLLHMDVFSILGGSLVQSSISFQPLTLEYSGKWLTLCALFGVYELVDLHTPVPTII